MQERINSPIPTEELERRWALIRAAMESAGIDVLLAQANNDFVGGYVRYLTDNPATNGYWTTVTFPLDRPMTVIGQGGFGVDLATASAADPVRRGVGRFLGVPSYSSVHYTVAYEVELAERALAGYEQARIGLLGPGAMSYEFIDRLRRGAFAGATFVDASDLVDGIKAVKSPIELEFVRETARAQDAALAAVVESIRPGMTELQAAAIAERAGHDFGSEQGIFLACSDAIGSPGQIVNRHLQGRRLREGDQLALLIENNGAGGYYCEIGRTIVLGKATPEMREQHEFVVGAQDFCTELLAPGADPAAIWERYNAYMREHGRPEEKRLHFHGQGYDMVERPLVRFDETMAIAPNMYFALHPAYSTERTYSWACDNFLLREDGSVERLHQTERSILELG